MKMSEADRYLNLRNSIDLNNDCSLCDILPIDLILISDYLGTNDDKQSDWVRIYLYGVIDKFENTRTEADKLCRSFIVQFGSVYYFTQWYSVAILIVRALLVKGGIDDGYNNFGLDSEIGKYIED